MKASHKKNARTGRSYALARAEYLKDERLAIAYLSKAMQSAVNKADWEYFRMALKNVNTAHPKGDLANILGLSINELENCLSEETEVSASLFTKMFSALGLRVSYATDPTAANLAQESSPNYDTGTSDTP